MFKRYFSEYIVYFLFFVIISVWYIVNGYAVLGTNDDWALWGMLNAKGIYGTLIMSYPLSYILSKLYDIFPSFPWYSALLSFIIGINFYLIALYIKRTNIYLQKIILFVLAFILLSLLWFSITITGVTVLTMASAIGLLRVNMVWSFIFVLIASFLRTDIMFILLPYYAVSFFMLRTQYRLNRRELFTLVMLVIMVSLSLFVQKQDKSYSQWLAFNKARSAIVDMGILNVEKDYFSTLEKFCYQVGWFQDSALLSSEKLIATTPKLIDILKANLKKLHFMYFLKMYKFKYWLWLLLAVSLIALILKRGKFALLLLLFVFGVVLLLITRDVERVTVPLLILWAYILFEILKPYKVINTIFLFLFTYIFYTYAVGQFTYKNYKENTQLQAEARKLIHDSNRSCEVSINFPTNFSYELLTVVQANYLFREKNWLQINDKEVLPNGWLVRHEFFYKTHHLSDKYTKRKYQSYHDFLVADETAFFGSKALANSKNFKILLNAYDTMYLENKPECKHKVFVLKRSRHFAITQIQVDCSRKKDKGHH